jgi:hypothetical protein
LKELKDAKREAGDLEGILLTGFGVSGIDLCENYLDRTGDLQSICLLVCSAGVCNNDPRVERWIERYRRIWDKK